MPCTARFVVPALFLVSTLALAQESKPEPEARRPPALLVRPDGQEPSRPLRVERVALRLDILGRLARAEVDITFRNDLDRILEGSLVLPLPEGATISDVALEVGGELRAGVVVERERAEVVFEEVVRRNVDPALVEWVRGNVFRMRVYPIPARGTKRCVLAYEWEPAGDIVLPLAFGHELASVRFDLTARDAHPTIEATPFPPDLPEEWKETEGRLAAHFEGANLTLERDLRIGLPEVGAPVVAVEQGRAGRVFHAVLPIRAPERDGATTGGSAAAERVTVLYDVSWSRAGVDRAKERAFIEAVLVASGAREVRLIPFSNEVLGADRFALAPDGPKAFLERFDSLVFDGGTRLGCLEASLVDGADRVLLFTDGLGTLGAELPGLGENPRTHVISSQGTADTIVLDQLAPQSRRIDLARLTVPEATAALLAPSVVFLGARGKGLEDVAPIGPLAVRGHLSLCGRMAGNEPAVVTCRFAGSGVTWEQTFLVSPAASAGTRIDRAWARQAVMGLVPFAAHEEAIRRIGLDHGIVTPATSLLVLESLEDYVRYRVKPPAEWVGEWAERIEALGLQETSSRAERMAHLRKRWQARVAWWERKFEYDPGFRFQDPEKVADADAGVEDGTWSAGDPTVTAEPAVDADDLMRSPPSETERAGAEAKEKAAPGGSGSGIAIQPWNPETPYLSELRKAGDDAYATYLALRGAYGQSSAFFLDVADFFLDERQDRATALRVLSNIAEMDIASASLLRILGHRLAQMDELGRAAEIFAEVRRLRPQDPQSHRDLGLVLARLGRYAEAIPLLEEVATGEWDDRFPEIEALTLGELNRVIARCQRETGQTYHTLPADLVNLLDVDVRVVLTWDADNCDMDLWVIEPSGEKAYFGHRQTTIGGFAGPDFTGGYGPEEYWVRRAMPGKFLVKVNYYGNRQQTLAGATTIQVTIFKNYGRTDEERVAVTRRLADVREVLDLGDVVFDR